MQRSFEFLSKITKVSYCHLYYFIFILCTYFGTVEMLAFSALYNHNGLNRQSSCFLPRAEERKTQAGKKEEERNCHNKSCAAKCILIIFKSLVIYFCFFVQGPLTVGFLFQRCTCHSSCFCRLHSTLVLLYSLFAGTVKMYLPLTPNPEKKLHIQTV